MDADCLIKLTKSKLKELVCRNFTVVVPQTVKEEVVDNAARHPDSAIIRENLDAGLLSVKKSSYTGQGEDEVFKVFKQGGFDAVCSDDERFLKRLQVFDMPYITPSVFIALLLKKGTLTVKEARKRLEELSPFVSDDEYNAVKLVLENWRVQ